MPAGGACDAPPTPSLTTTAWGPFLTANWSAVPGAGAYLFSYSGPVPAGVVPFGGNTHSFVYPGLPQGTWAFGVQAQFSCGSVGGVGQSNLTVDGSSLRLDAARARSGARAGAADTWVRPRHRPLAGGAVPG